MRKDLNLPPEHRKVLAVIQHCRGRAQAVKNAEIAKAAGLSERYTRLVLAELQNEFGVAIGTAYGSDGGRYIITDPAELAETRDQKIKHGLAILSGAYKMDRSAGAAIRGQVELIFKEG